MAASNNCVSKRPPIPSCSRRTMSSSVSRLPRSTKRTCKFAKAAAISDHACRESSAVRAPVWSPPLAAPSKTSRPAMPSASIRDAAVAPAGPAAPTDHRFASSLTGWRTTRRHLCRVCAGARQNCFGLPQDSRTWKARPLPSTSYPPGACCSLTPSSNQENLVLIRGIGDGVATAALQLALSLAAHTIVTTDSAENISKALGLGAEHAIDEGHEDFAQGVRRLTAKRGVDVVVDCVGGDRLGQKPRRS